MNIKYHIASLAIIGLLFTGCQKTEFSELMEEDLVQQESRQSEDVLFDNVTLEGTSLFDDAGLIDDENPKKDDSGVVKEVSDGDEESDDDENTDN
ncbi:MAG: hypothetical protein HQ500_07455 [Flavobacteriales bacterium]|nr:hypothetical protein [Flavobacteriales bacterium]